jgi:putative transposase
MGRCSHAFLGQYQPPYIKGKSAIYIARNYLGKRRSFKGQHFWARGYYVSTVGIDEDVMREYIRQQENEDRHVDQLSLWN